MRLTEKEEAAVRRNFGIVPLETAEGLAALEYGLAQKLAQMVVMPGDAAKVAEVLGVVASPVHHDGSNERVAPAAADVGANDCVISAGNEPGASDCVVSAGNGSGAGSDDLIAIIGLSGRYPQAETLEEFWDNLKIGRDCIVEVPKDRWDVASHFQPGRPMPGKTYGKWGGFLSSVDQFDSLFFNISPKEAEHMDPHERLFLETAALAIEDAGYTPDTLAAPEALKDNPVGVYAGVMWGDYQLHAVDEGVGSSATPHSFYWAVANRVSHFFNFSGPSFTVDTACSSSLTAIHLACAALQRGEISVAIAGGGNLALHPHKYNLVSDLQMLSADGRCRSFGAGGDGYVPGEGGGVVLLKSLSRARADGDHIYAIIRGSALNHGGKTSGFTVPNPKRQAPLIQEAFRFVGVHPRHMGYVEAHGTGTIVGDPIEVTSLSNAFAQSERQYCPIGSVKSNIGHLEAASGIAGLTKVLLQMKHRMLAPSIHSSKPNPYIDLRNSPYHVQQVLAEWRRHTIDGVEITRLAGISSFGAGGANAHLIVEEYCETDASPASGRQVLIVLSAKKDISLKATAAKLADFLESHPDTSLDDVAYTLQIGRVAMDVRLAIIADQVSQVVDRLRAYVRGEVSGESASGLFSGTRGDWKGEADQATVRWTTERDLPCLAAAWVGGFGVDGEFLHDRGVRKRLSLPGYSFHRQRYWINKAANARAGAGTVASLHPLLDAHVSTLEEQTFRKTIRPQEFFLRDHRLGDNRIVPAVAYLEMALQASRLASVRSRVVALYDVSWMKPIVVNEGSETMLVGLVPERGAVRFEIYPSPGEPRDVHSRGLVQLAEAAESDRTAPVPLEGGLGLKSVMSRCRRVSREAIEALFAQMGFAFGPTYQVFDTLYSNADEALARLRPPQQSDRDAKAYVLHPSLLDGAVRTALGIDGFSASVPGIQVPVGLRRIDIVLAVDGDCFAYAKRSSVIPVQADQRAYDILVLDPNGRMLVRIEGLVIQPAPQLSLSLKKSRSVSKVMDPAPVRATAQPTKMPSALPEEARTEVSGSGATGVTKQVLQAAVTALLVDLISKVTNLATDLIDPKAPHESYGIDSVMIRSLNESLERTFGELPKTLFIEYLEIQSLVEYLVENHPDGARSLIVLSAISPARSPALPTAVAAPTDTACGSPERMVDLLFTSLKAVLGSASQDCTRTTPLAAWPLDPVSACMLVARQDREEVEGLSPSALYRFQTLQEWAASLTFKQQAAVRAQPVGTEKPRTHRFVGTSSGPA